MGHKQIIKDGYIMLYIDSTVKYSIMKEVKKTDRPLPSLKDLLGTG